MINTKGFTLIEIMIVIAILAILATAGISAFDSQKRKGYRTDAIRSVSVMAQKMENWRSSTGAYTTNINDIRVSSVGPTVSMEEKYVLSLVSDAANESYTITATATGGQAQDVDCFQFVLEHTGRKTAVKADTTANTKCWPK